MIKVIGGKYRGRNLLTPPEETTLPSKNMVRGAIASACADEIYGANVLDLFAGSGALGIEMLSRGAAHCLFVEKDRFASSIVQKNLDTLKEKNGLVLNADYQVGISRAVEPFSLVLLDPPYKEKDYYQTAVDLLKEKGKLAKRFTIVLEFEGEIPFDLSPYEEVRRYTYGKTSVIIVRGTL